MRHPTMSKDHIRRFIAAIVSSIVFSSSICLGQLFVQQSSTMGGGIIHPSGSTISSQKLVMSPSAMPTGPSLMNVVAAKKSTETNQHKEEDKYSTLPEHPQTEMLPEAAALSATNIDDASNETLSSLKDSLPSPNKSLKSSSYKDKSNRDQKSKAAKKKDKKNPSKFKGSPSHDEGTCASENNCGPLDIIDESLSKEPTSGLALQPIQSDLLSLNIRPAGGPDYNIHELPSLDGKPVDVKVSVSLRNILEIDEHKQLITLETTIRLYWRDPRLAVDHLLGGNNQSSSAHIKGVGGAPSNQDYILLHPETASFIWFPDIYIDFAKALRMPTVIVRPASLRIYRNSTVRYATQINYDVACPMNFKKYPYDTQLCKIKYESYGHTIDKMNVSWKKGFDQSKVTDNNYISLAQFEYAVFFEENYQEEIASGVYPGVVMTLLLRRKISYHLLQTYLPSGLFVIVAWLSLFLPPESIPGRVTMAMTTLLTLAAMFGAVRQSTPRVSYVSALDIWMCTCIIFVFFALLEYVVVLCLIHHCKATAQRQQQMQTMAARCQRPSGWGHGCGGQGEHNQLFQQNPMSNIKPKDTHITAPNDIPYADETPDQCPTTTSTVDNGVKAIPQISTDSIGLNAEQQRETMSMGMNTSGVVCTTVDTTAPTTFLSAGTVGNVSISPCQTTHVVQPSSPCVTVKRRNIFSCCSRRRGQPRRRVSASMSMPVTGCCSNQHMSSAKNYNNVKKESRNHQRMCSNADPNRYQCGGGLVTDNVNILKKSRPFQTVEKICSALMAILFLLFNALYWPWLLREGDFDYEKFEKAVFTGSQ